MEMDKNTSCFQNYLNFKIHPSLKLVYIDYTEQWVLFWHFHRCIQCSLATPTIPIIPILWHHPSQWSSLHPNTHLSISGLIYVFIQFHIWEKTMLLFFLSVATSLSIMRVSSFIANDTLALFMAETCWCVWNIMCVCVCVIKTCTVHFLCPPLIDDHMGWPYKLGSYE